MKLASVELININYDGINDNVSWKCVLNLQDEAGIDDRTHPDIIFEVVCFLFQGLHPLAVLLGTFLKIHFFPVCHLCHRPSWPLLSSAPTRHPCKS